MSTTTQVLWRRGTASQVAAFTPSTGEIVVDLTNGRIVVGDSSTPGGITGAKIQDLNNQNITNAVYSTGSQSISGHKTFLDHTYFVGTLLGDDNYNGAAWINLSGGYLGEGLSIYGLWTSGLLYDGSYLTLNWVNKYITGNWSSQSLNITENFNTNPSLNSSNVNLNNSPLYINTSSSSVNYVLPAINTCTGRNYFIKNKGNSIILSGTYPDTIFAGYPVLNFTISSGSAYQVINDGQHWDIL